MDLDIITAGDAIFLARVMQAVSMLHSAGTFQALAAIGLLVGLIAVGVKGMQSGGQKVDLTGWGTGLILYMVLFIPTVDVDVEDAFPGWGRPTEVLQRVDGVPIGIAAMGWGISNMSAAITTRMLQVYSTPARPSSGNPTDGFGRSLMWLATMRNAGSVGVPTGTDAGLEYQQFVANLRNLLIHCSEYKLQADPAIISMLAQHPKLLDESAFGSGDLWRLVPFVTLARSGDLINHVERWTSCQAGTEELKNAVYVSDSAVIKSLYKTINHKVSPDSNDITESVSQAADLLGTTAESMQEYALAHVVKSAISEVVQSGFMNGHHFSLAAMVADAAEKRNAQFVGEENMFIRMSRPFMSFMEGMVYICAPFVAFALGLGSFGLGLAMRYAMVTLWVSLWGPTMAAITLFQTTMAEHAFAVVKNAHGGSTWNWSLAAAKEVENVAMDWIAAGSILAASTPAITLMMLYGSAMTAVGLANRLQGADTIKENSVSPDATNVSPGVTTTPLWNNSPGEGMTQPGISLPSFNISKTMSSGNSVAEGDVMTASERFSASSGKQGMISLANDLRQGYDARGNSELSRVLTGSRSNRASTGAEDTSATQNRVDQALSSLYAVASRQGVAISPTEMGKLAFMFSKAAGLLKGGSDAANGGDNGGKGGTGGKALSSHLSWENTDQNAWEKKAHAIMENGKRLAAKAETDAGVRGDISRRSADILAAVGSDTQTETSRVTREGAFRKEASDLREATTRAEQTNSAVTSAQQAQQMTLSQAAHPIATLTRARAEEIARQSGIDPTAINWGSGSPGAALLQHAAQEWKGGDWQPEANAYQAGLGKIGDAREAALLLALSNGNGPERFADERAAFLHNVLTGSGAYNAVVNPTSIKAPETSSDTPPPPEHGSARNQVEAQKLNAPGSTLAAATAIANKPPSSAAAAGGANIDADEVQAAGAEAKSIGNGNLPELPKASTDAIKNDAKKNAEELKDESQPRLISDLIARSGQDKGVFGRNDVNGDATTGNMVDNLWDKVRHGKGSPTEEFMEAISRGTEHTPMNPRFADVVNALVDGSHPAAGGTEVPVAVAAVVGAAIAYQQEQTAPQVGVTNNTDTRTVRAAPGETVAHQGMNAASELPYVQTAIAALSPGQAHMVEAILGGVQEDGSLSGNATALLRESDMSPATQQKVDESADAMKGKRINAK